MLELKKGIDILGEIGGVKTLDEAQAVFEAKCDQENLAKIGTIANEEALLLAKYLRGEKKTWIPRIAIPEAS